MIATQRSWKSRELAKGHLNVERHLLRGVLTHSIDVESRNGTGPSHPPTESVDGFDATRALGTILTPQTAYRTSVDASKP